MKLYKIEIDYPGPKLPGEAVGAGTLVDAKSMDDARRAQSDWLNTVNSNRAKRNAPLMIAGRIRDVTPRRWSPV